MTEFTVSARWRYPVKSMAGEELHDVDVTASFQSSALTRLLPGGRRLCG